MLRYISIYRHSQGKIHICDNQRLNSLNKANSKEIKFVTISEKPRTIVDRQKSPRVSCSDYGRELSSARRLDWVNYTRALRSVVDLGQDRNGDPAERTA